ncbi:MAG: AbrB/MazE/SpoVT family DNA-binding domain-containing protein, partial [Haliea sp.]
VLLSSKNQIVIPKDARDKLNIGPGSEMLVLCKEDRVVLIPKPRDFTSRTAGLHKDIWRQLGGGAAYLKDERSTWDR